jgi:uncharacterized phage protein gp47/JayE
MAYQAPYVDASGLHINTYQDVLDHLETAYRSIFGDDVYLENDSQDHQWISALSLLAADANQSLQVDYNNRAPAHAIGASLDSLVKLNGVKRKSASYSSCQLTLTGVAGSVITNGVAQDVNGYKWDLPTPVEIPAGGSIVVTAICEALGAVAALAGTITKISTPTAGWTAVTNASAATQGQPVEADSTLRGRQSVSTMLPSKTLFEGTKAAISAIFGVTRSNVLENFTNVEDDNGLAPHSIWAVVEGGADAAIASAIALNKGDGCGVNGTTTVAVTKPDGTTVNIKFSRPTYVPIYVIANVQLLTGGTSEDLASIKAAVYSYLQSLQIGAPVTNAIRAAAYSVMPDLAKPVFSIQSLYWGIAPAPDASTDVAIDFDHVAEGVLANITVNSI